MTNTTELIDDNLLCRICMSLFQTYSGAQTDKQVLAQAEQIITLIKARYLVEVIEVVKAVHYKTEAELIKALEQRFGDNKRGESDG